MVERYRNRRGVYKRRPLVNSKRELLIPTSEIDVCPMWQDEGLPELGIPPASLFFYYPDGRWLLARPSGIGTYTEWEALTPLDARHWLLDNGYALEELSEKVRAALAWDSNHSEERRTHQARVARADKGILEGWQRRTGIAQVELLTQAVEALYGDLDSVEEESVEAPAFKEYSGAKIRRRALGALRESGRRLQLTLPQVFHVALSRFDPREAVHDRHC
ncbi:MAG: hypothetical protein OXO48_12730 [Caldilineaceae bacterium]|nr:hypothetical protein [Caldilineaceae bacterium]